MHSEKELTSLHLKSFLQCNVTKNFDTHKFLNSNRSIFHHFIFSTIKFITYFICHGTKLKPELGWGSSLAPVGKTCKCQVFLI